MLTLNEEQTKKLQAQVDAGQFATLEEALDALFEDFEPFPLTEEELAEHRRRIAAIERGEGILEFESKKELEDHLLKLVAQIRSSRVAN